MRRTLIFTLLILGGLLLAGCHEGTQTWHWVTPEPPVPTIEPSLMPTVTPTPEPCMLKGNISRDGEKILHSPGQLNYERTIIDPELGEKMFCTLEEAVAEGWRPAQQ